MGQNFCWTGLQDGPEWGVWGPSSIQLRVVCDHNIFDRDRDHDHFVNYDRDQFFAIIVRFFKIDRDRGRDQFAIIYYILK